MDSSAASSESEDERPRQKLSEAKAAALLAEGIDDLLAKGDTEQDLEDKDDAAFKAKVKSLRGLDREGATELTFARTSAELHALKDGASPRSDASSPRGTRDAAC